MEKDVVYVRDKKEQLIAVFKKDDKDTLINPRVTETQNSEATFTFSISPKNKKWEQIKNPENLYVISNKVFSTNFEGCFEEIVSDNGEELITVKAYESQKLLSRRYVRAWNSTTGFENIDTFMVVILSNGNLDLYNNDVLVESIHPKGSSGYVLDALLYGTGWKTGICDVKGVFDFETDQIDIYENILKVQSIWGGILIFDSLNKIIHHRDETVFLPYSGYEVKAEKNMQSLEQMYNNKIITKLCPLGEGGLNIKSVNNNSEWLTNYSYTDSVLEGIVNNPDIYDASQLKMWGQRMLQDLCKPRKELTVKLVLLNKKKGYELETIELNDIVEVFNYNNSNETEQLRVVSYDYGIWDNSDAVVELSDVTLESTDIFKKNVQATNNINNGTLNSEKVVVFHKNGSSLNDVLLNIDTTIVNTKSELTKTDNEINARVETIVTDVDSLNNEIVSQTRQIEDLKLTIEGLKNTVTVKGGNNIFYYDVGYWASNETLNIEEYTNSEIQQNSLSGRGYLIHDGSSYQDTSRQVEIVNGIYNVSFKYKKIGTELANVSVKINDKEYELNEINWTDFNKTIEVTTNSIKVEFISDTNNALYVADLMGNIGAEQATWTQNPNETRTDTVTIGKGIKVESTEKNTIHRIDADGNRTYNKETGDIAAELTDKGLEAEEVISRGKAELSGLLVKQVEDQVWLSSLL